MGDMKVGSVEHGDMTNTVTDYSVPTETLDSPQDQKETEYINTNWPQQLGHYKNVADLRAAIDALARWTIGKGFKSNETTELTLMAIRGHGKDTFNTILENQIKVAKIGGDSYAEVVRDDDEYLVNLKPLNPEHMKIVANRKGIILKYQLMDKKTVKHTFQPDEIFHLSRNRIGDEIHGISMVDVVEDLILAKQEAMKDMRILMHRHVKPIIKWQLDTDIPAEIEAFKAKADAAVENGENIFIPMGAVEADVLAVPANATLNPLPWINYLDNNWYKVTGVPQIVVGGSDEITEASSKISYLAWQQTVEESQLEIEEQVLAQLNLEIELEFPASLQNEMLSDKDKSETMQASTPEDTSLTGGMV